MAKEPRIHHYIPQAYLRGFGWKRSKSWHVCAADLKARKFIQPNTKNICAERDFLRIEVAGYPPNMLEREMGKFETRVREAILRVSESKRFEGDDRIMILNLMALLAVRHPLMRENMRQFHERAAKLMMDLVLAKKERWNAQVQSMRAEGNAPKEEVTYEQMKEFHDRDQYTIEVAREYHIETELELVEPVLQTLLARRWKLYYAGKGQGHFVTTDRPVVLTWNHPEKVPLMQRRSPGFGMIDTEVAFPLTHQCFLLGRFEGMLDGSEEAYAGFIARCNTRMISQAFDYAIMIDESFPYLMPFNEVYWDNKFMERMKAYSDKNPREEEV